MANKVTFYGYIKKGKWGWHHNGIFQAYCQGQKDGDYSLTAEPSVHPKTLPQMAYYYAVIVPEALKAMKEQGNETYQIPISGKVKELKINEDIVDAILKSACKAKSKGRMSMEEASEFLDKCIRWCARYLGCVIPDPDPNWKCNKSLDAPKE